MEESDQKNFEPNETKSLTFFMNSDDTDLSTLTIESFFKTNIPIVRLDNLNIEEREAIREEFKNYLDTFLRRMVGNSLNSYVLKWKKKRRKESKEAHNHRLSSPIGPHRRRIKSKCYNCGKRGHFKRECKETLVECQFCKKKGHLIQFCYGRKPNSIKNFKSDSSKKVIAVPNDERAIESIEMKKPDKQTKDLTGSDKYDENYVELNSTERIRHTENDTKLTNAFGKERYALIIETLTYDKIKHTPMVIVRKEQRRAQTFIDEGSDVSLISENKWISLGRPTIKNSYIWVSDETILPGMAKSFNGRETRF